mmetsp:Transcript_6544/g.16747  ORF Transcript_6544/g.16747 Transcript_6544/m.16747 type:complete len:195 (-) Transcript_6544:277-861(-)|eukprot:CAMPEP_0197588080 /NCGR_PEP_ID=MMETSP1326-20131121/9493_1 /TAXON_ID=1155430 /ORGANISM="Genus nov. species nov., Strain RCC2288" /LENGTH=194 /DNA_ID=CAMNT_0043152873 /DNA_START=151 /DNA_END=735 /DNA_ORIENTATION=-
MKAPSEVQAKSVGEVVLTWNTELDNRTSSFAAKAKGLAEWDRHILKNRHQLMALQVDLGKASSSQDRLERQLDILQVHQKEICDALTVMESEAEHLSRTPQNNRGSYGDQGPVSQETLYTLAETISAHLSNLGDVLHAVVPSPANKEEESSNGYAEHTLHALPTEVLKSQLQSLHSIEQKIDHASAELQRAAKR